jgi:hypothetical protein
VSGRKIERALLVLLLDPKVRALLADRDPNRAEALRRLRDGATFRPTVGGDATWNAFDGISRTVRIVAVEPDGAVRLTFRHGCARTCEASLSGEEARRMLSPEVSPGSKLPDGSERISHRGCAACGGPPRDERLPVARVVAVTRVRKIATPTGEATVTRKRDGGGQVYFDVDAPEHRQWIDGEHSRVAWSEVEVRDALAEETFACPADCDCRD